MITLTISFEDARVLLSALDVYAGTQRFALEEPQDEEEESEANYELESSMSLYNTIEEKLRG